MKQFKITKTKIRELTHSIKVNNSYLQDIKCFIVLRNVLKDFTNSTIQLSSKDIEATQKTLREAGWGGYLTINSEKINPDSKHIGHFEVSFNIGESTTGILIYTYTDNYILEEIKN